MNELKWAVLGTGVITTKPYLSLRNIIRQSLLHGKHVEDMETAILTGNTAIMKLYADVTMTQK